MARILGTLLADALAGSDEADTMYGGGGEAAPSDLADTVLAGGGNDLLYGNGGNDLLLGQLGADTVYAGVGDDTLYGGSGFADTLDTADMLYGHSGADWLFGNAGGDTLEAGDGTDTLYGGLGNDLIYGGNNFTSEGDGADWIAAGWGNDTIYGGEGDDSIFGGNGISDSLDSADTLDGGSGNDILYGNGGDDSLIGGTGNDTLYGGVGADTLEGGLGDDVYVAESGDVVIGGEGSDRYVLMAAPALQTGIKAILDSRFSIPDSFIRIENAERGEEIRILGLNGREVEVVTKVGGAEIRVGDTTLADVSGSAFEQLVRVQQTQDNVVRFYVNAADTVAGGSRAAPVIEDFEPTLTLAESAVNGGAVVLDSTLTVTDADSSYFRDGSLQVSYGGGNGAASETLSVQHQGNGAGQIGYVGGVASFEGTAFATVSGGDNGTAGDQLAFDFDDNATLAAVEALIENLTYANSSDAPAASRSLEMTLNDGLVSGLPVSMTVTITPENDAPVTAGIANQGTDEDTAWSFTLPAGTFTDSDGDALTLTATLANGNPLPAWMSFDATTRTFSGTPTGADTGTYALRVTAMDPSAASVFSNFFLGVSNVNDAPVLDNAIANQSATEDAAFAFTVPANTFSDPFPIGDVLSYSATLTSGAALPAWLSFDTVTGAFSGTPLNSHVGTLSVRVTATDLFSATVSDDFDIVVANTNDAPTLANALLDQSVSEGAAFSYSFAANSFNDVDSGDALTYTVTSALPGWLSFDDTTRTFTGTPANADVGFVDVTVRATDGSAATVDDTFRITVQDVNEAPVMTAATPSLTGINEDPTTNNGDSISSLLGATVTDADAGAVEGIAITATTGTGDWQYYDGAAWQNVGVVATNSALLLADATSIRFVPSANASGAASFDYVAWDRSAGSAGSKVDVTTRGTTTAFSTQQNTANIAVTAVNDAPTLSSATDITLAAINEDDTNPAGDTVTNLFSGRYVDTESAAFAGVAVTANAATAGQGVWQYKVGAGAWTSIGTGITAATAVILDPTALLRFLPATNFNGTVGALTAALWDGTGMAFASGSTQNVTTLTNDAADPFSNASLNLTTSITSVNDAPVLNSGVSDQFVSVPVGTNYTVPGGTFSDVDIATNGQSLSYTLEYYNGSAWTSSLPTGISFAGNVIAVAPGTTQSYYEMRVTATDDGAPTLSTTSTFLMAIAESSNFGTPAADTLTGTASNDMIISLASNDIAYGMAGNDTVFGNDGSDTLYGDTILGGTAGADLIYGNDGNDSLYGDSSDLVSGGSDTLYGGAGGDQLYGYAGSDTLYGEADNDYLDGGNDNDTLDSGDGNDTLYGGSGNDALLGGLGDDTIYGEAGADTITSGAGSDYIQILIPSTQSTAASPDVITDFVQGSDRMLIAGYLSISAGNAAASTATALTYEYDAANSRTRIYGSAGAVEVRLTANAANPTGNYTLTASDYTFATSVGDGNSNTISGGGGVDVIYTFGGDDVVTTNNGNDTVYAGSGNDMIVYPAGSSADTLYLEGGEDLVRFYNYGSGGSWQNINDFVRGDDRIMAEGLPINNIQASGSFIYGAMTYSYNAGLGVTELRGSFGSNAPDARYIQVRVTGNITPTADDFLLDYKSSVASTPFYGTLARDGVFDTAGNDVIFASETNGDAILADMGDDTIYAGPGINYATGLGNDLILYRTSSGYINGGAGSDFYNAGWSAGGITQLSDSGNEGDIFIGSASTDGVYLRLGAGDDVLFLGGGVDRSHYVPLGDSGNDMIHFGAGDDYNYVTDDVGADTLIGSAGADTIGGGATAAQSDQFWYTYASDSASAAPDLIGRGTSGATADFQAGVDKIFLHGAIGGTALQVTGGIGVGAGQVTVGAYSGVYTPITINGLAGFEIRITGNYAATLTSSDFIFSNYNNQSAVGSGQSITGTSGSATAGADAIFGSAFNDTIDGGTGYDVIYGGAGADSITGGALVADTWWDEVYGEAGNDTLIGGSGYDTLDGGADNDQISGNDGTDWIYGGNHNDTLYGNNGHDFLYGDANDDTLYGGAGADYLTGGTGVDKLYGEADLDFIQYDVSDITSDDALDYSGGSEIDSLIGISGTGLTAALLDGVDVVGIERFELANATATLVFGAGYDDTTGTDSIYGGTIVVDGANSTGSTLNLNASALDIQLLMMGGAGTDTVTGGNGNDTLQGGTGNDTITGGNGNDILLGGTGADSLSGGAGSDVYEFTAAADSTTTSSDIIYSFTDGQDKIQLNGAEFYLKSFSDLTISYSGTQTIVSTNAYGTAFSFKFDAALGNITSQLDATDFVFVGYAFNGAAAAETFRGTTGNDTIVGGGGADTISGGIGQDVLTGGAALDRFTFSATSHSLTGMGDTITNFNANADLLVFTGLLSGTFSFVGNEAQAFAGSGNSSARFNDTTKLLEIDTNGDSVVDMAMTLTGVALTDLSATDFGWS